jgi:hypothetical protein
MGMNQMFEVPDGKRSEIAQFLFLMTIERILLNRLVSPSQGTDHCYC